MSTTSADIARGERTLATALHSKSDTELECRRMRHAWRQQNVTTTPQEGGTTLMRVHFVCMRGCEVYRYDDLTVRQVGKSGNYRIVDRSAGHYTYPAGYQIPGVPRGVAPSIIQWQEYVRRMNEKAARAKPGERERSA